MNKIPLFKPCIDDDEQRIVCDVLQSGVLSRGPKVEEFENKFAKLTGRRFAIAVNSGTSGLDLCLKALGIHQGDEVITSAYSFIASVNCILYQSATPVLCDVENNNFLMDSNKIDDLITQKTKAILPVDIFGQSYDVAKLQQFDLPIIVDSCEAFGVPPCDGALANVYGFYPNKQITTGEGGMIVTENEKFALKLLSMRNQGFIQHPDYLAYIDLGFNFRMSDINAAVGIAQLNKYRTIMDKRREAANLYASMLNIPGVHIIVDPDNSALFNYPIVVESEILKHAIANSLNDDNIDYSFGFPPLYKFAHIKKAIDGQNLRFPNTESLAKRTIVLPFFTDISKEQISRVVAAIKKGADKCDR